jgi:hypothetical protein
VNDPGLRDLERALRASPFDEALSLRYLQELRRAGRVAPDAPEGVFEPVPNPGIRAGDLVLVTRRSRPRVDFAWLPEMDALLGRVFRVKRATEPASVAARDGLSCFLEGPSLVDAPGVVGRSVGFASVVRL